MQDAGPSPHEPDQSALRDGLSFYEILDLNANDSLTKSEIKAAYKRALLQHHPDKQTAKHSVEKVTIDEISLAYQVLSNPAAKQEYDAALSAQNGQALPGRFSVFRTGLETVDLDDLSFDENQGIWTRQCRCGVGGGYTVTDDDLEKHVDERELITGCKGCSLWIRILFSVA